jgi:hypothetical protein
LRYFAFVSVVHSLAAYLPEQKGILASEVQKAFVDVVKALRKM